MNVNQSRIEREWHRRGFSCGLWVDPPGREWEGYHHSVDELLLVIEGDLEVEIEGKQLRPVPDAEVTIPAGARHSVRNVGTGVARWLYGYRTHA